MPTLSRDCAVFPTVLCTVIAWCAAATSATAADGTGGASIPVAIAPTTGATGYGQPGMRTLLVPPTGLLGSVLVARGTMPRAAGRQVVLQRLDPRRGWRNVARTRVRSTTRFAVGWRPNVSGKISLRAVVARRGAQAAGTAPTAETRVYRPALATFFGPGLYGRETACGMVLTPDLHGVAHKRLPCGTLVAILYGNREIVVPVVDRGPFNGGYRWDLTQATADALGFSASGGIGYVRASPRPPQT
jgi:peptidoglycan lytic transglycosylase